MIAEGSNSDEFDSDSSVLRTEVVRDATNYDANVLADARFLLRPMLFDVAARSSPLTCTCLESKRQSLFIHYSLIFSTTN